MNFTEKLISLFVVCVIAILPHLGLIPFFGYSIPIILIVWYALKYSKENFSVIGFSFKRFELKAMWLGLLFAILILSFMQLVFFPFVELFYSFEETEVGLYDFIRENKWQYLFVVIMGWIIGGLYEEIVFHGFIFTRVEKMIQVKFSMIISFAVTSIIFGLYHYQLGTAGLINAFIVGSAYLGVYLYFDRNLWYSIFFHGFYNTFVMTLIYHGWL